MREVCLTTMLYYYLQESPTEEATYCMDLQDVARAALCKPVYYVDRFC